MKHALEAMIDHYRLRGKYNQSRIRQLWSEMMGPSIVQYTVEIKIHKRILYVNLSSAPLRHELSMGREKIKDMLNEKLGTTYLQDVVIR